MALLQVVVALLTAHTCFGAETVKLIINECFDDLVLENYHNYTGKVVTPPPKDIKKDSQTIIEYEYGRLPIFESYLDGNINYYGANGKRPTEFHAFVNVNKTGGIYLFVTGANPKSLESKGCSDVMDGGGKLPSVIGVYSYEKENMNSEECKRKTPNIADCRYEFPVINGK